MDKKKLFGTIIGVILFIALIAGATFAWLTFQATVTNGNYNTKTGNFLINYTKGENVTDIPIISIDSASDIVTSEAKSVTVKAGKSNSSNPNGNLTIKLKTVTESTNLDLTSGVLKYAISIEGAAPTSIQSVTSTADLILVSNYLITSTTQVDFTVYFWLDSSTVDSDDMGKTYSGYIDAEAVQVG